MSRHTALVLALGAVVQVLVGAAAPQDADNRQAAITVTGCVERDAATTTPIYKIVVPRPDGGSIIYQLNATGSAVPAAVGKTAEVSGTVSIERRGGREIRVLTVKSFKVVVDRCASTTVRR